MSTATEWSTAFARQAKADWLAYECLVLHTDVPTSEPLHMLQMAIEKLVKAHLYPTFPNPALLRGTRAVISKHLPTIFKSLYARQHKGTKPSGSLMVGVRRIAIELDCLHPANEAGGSRPDNCEYPWERSKNGTVLIPSEYHFEIMNLFHDRSWFELAKIIKSEIDRLAAT